MKTTQPEHFTIEKYVDANTVATIRKVLNTESFQDFIVGTTELATIFGDLGNFKLLTSTDESDYEMRLLSSFQKNTQLLVQKTWIEKEDETLKDKISFQLDTICESLTQKKYCNCYQEFIDCLENIVFLMFGAQIRKPDFAEYALRIDPEFGIFWWVLQNISNETFTDKNFCRIYELLAMTFLANY